MNRFLFRLKKFFCHTTLKGSFYKTISSTSFLESWPFSSFLSYKWLINFWHDCGTNLCYLHTIIPSTLAYYTLVYWSYYAEFPETNGLITYSRFFGKSSSRIPTWVWGACPRMGRKMLSVETWSPNRSWALQENPCSWYAGKTRQGSRRGRWGAAGWVNWW